MSGHSTTAYAEVRPDLERLLTINDVAELLVVSRDKVYGLIRRGDLHPVRVGAHARFEPEEIRGYIARAREAATDLPTIGASP